ncbi:MAG: response regulator [Planctomycetota bacterium]|nr:MAG: response regulator [Planctomycetota bacterium]
MRSELSQPLPAEEPAGTVTVVHFAGSNLFLNGETFQRIHDRLVAIALAPGHTHLLLDFGNVEYISSAAIGTLVVLRRKLLAAGRHLTLRNMRPAVHEVFTVSKLDELLDVRPEDPEGGAARERQDFPIAYVLIVDDDVAVRHVLHVGLRSRGCYVWSAASGREAVELYRRHLDKIDLVLLDVTMPGMDGPRTLAALQDLSPTVCCCFMSGNLTDSQAQALLQAGAARVLRKPFAFAEVFDIVKRLSSRHCRQVVERWISLPSQGGDPC